jgi:hypothetical protein
MKRFKMVICSSLVVVSFSSFAQDQDLVQLKTRIHQDVTISNSDLDSLDFELNQYRKKQGDGAELGKVIKNAQSNNCLGECLKEAINSMNFALDQGTSSASAQKVISDAIKAEAPKMSGKSQTAQADMLKTKVHDQIRLRDPASDKDLDRDRLRIREHASGSPSGSRSMDRKGLKR